MRSIGLRWKLLNQTLILLPTKAIYWEEEQALIVSDLHIGKVGHFRKAGIAVPKLLEQEELATLADLIHDYKPAKLIFLGDLFHSDMNNDWNWLQLWRELFKDLRMILIEGNHDILEQEYYKQAHFEVYKELNLGPFLFVHDKADYEALPTSDSYILSGHIHPAIKLRGRGRQSILLSCFYFGKFAGILPAFGKFTGKCCLKTQETDSIFGILENKVVKIHPF
jgi:DNA ligase-associated metallophosphoesterase